MIRNFKTYESTQNKVVWRLPFNVSNEYFAVCLDKIKAPEKYVNYLLDYKRWNEEIAEEFGKTINPYIWVGCDGGHWNHKSDYNKYYRDYAFMGNVHPNKEDIERWKLKQTTKKYNL